MKYGLMLLAFVLGMAVGTRIERAKTFDANGFLRPEVADALFERAFDAPTDSD